MTAVAFGVLCALGFAWSTILMQLGLRDAHLSHFTALFLNLIGGCVVLVTAVPLMGGLRPDLFTWTGALSYAASGFAASLAGQAAIFAAISRIGSTRTASFVMADNVFALVLAFLVLGQTISLLSGVGMAILMAGAVAFIMETRGNGNRQGRPSAQDSRQTGIGIAMAVLSALCFAGGGVFRGLGVQAYPAAMVGAALSMLAPLAVVAVVFALRGRLREPLNVPRRNLWLLLLSGVATAVGTAFFILALQYGGTVAVTTALKNTQPLFIFALALALLHRHERLSLRLGLLVGVVVAGGVLTALGRG